MIGDNWLLDRIKIVSSCSWGKMDFVLFEELKIFLNKSEIRHCFGTIEK